MVCSRQNEADHTDPKGSHAMIRTLTLSAAAALTLALVAAQPAMAGRQFTNGLHVANGLDTTNGLDSMNGLDSTNGLPCVNGVDSNNDVNPEVKSGATAAPSSGMRAVGIRLPGVR